MLYIYIFSIVSNSGKDHHRYRTQCTIFIIISSLSSTANVFLFYNFSKSIFKNVVRQQSFILKCYTREVLKVVTIFLREKESPKIELKLTLQNVQTMETLRPPRLRMAERTDGTTFPDGVTFYTELHSTVQIRTTSNASLSI